MLGWIIGILTFCLLLKAYNERKRMGFTFLIYLIILVIDLLVGGAMIMWKCVLREEEEECSLAYGGTVGSVIIWLVVMLLCPLCTTKGSLFDIAHGVRSNIKYHLEKIRPSKNREWVETGLFLPSLDSKRRYKITALDENSNGIVINSEFSVIPGGRGTIRGIPDVVNTAEHHKTCNDGDLPKSEGSLRTTCSEVNET